MVKRYDVVVIGGGHAGCEAAAAAARLGGAVLLITFSKDNIGEMSCNPSIGGVGKGIIVREIDALDGLMGRAADMAGIHFKILNRSKGPAVWGHRAQMDRKLYKKAILSLIEQQNIDIIEDEVIDIDITSSKVRGVVTEKGAYYSAGAIVLCTGTFLDANIHIGSEITKAGRRGASASVKLAKTLIDAGFCIKRLKTGTPPRLKKSSINWEVLETQPGDAVIDPFSIMTEKIANEQINCYITHTNEVTHEIIRKNMHLSPMYGDQRLIDSIGPRYCPSIEDKIRRFKDKNKHQVFLEPEGLDDDTIYPNGISTSLPKEVQLLIIASIMGLENAELKHYGYAVEYGCFCPTGLKPTLETKMVKGLYFAGQINGTTGYEEAAGQGIVAGSNAFLNNVGGNLVLTRDESYIGVMIDDLIRFGALEPYRIMTCRAEYRILLRPDNVYNRLFYRGLEVGLISDARKYAFRKWLRDIERTKKILKDTIIESEKVKKYFGNKTKVNKNADLLYILSVMGIDEGFLELCGIRKYKFLTVNHIIAETIYNRLKERLVKDIQLLQEESKMNFYLKEINYSMIDSLSNEMKEKLKFYSPQSFEELSKMPGVTPAAILAIKVFIKNKMRGN